jgi:hypothetical protein
MVTKLLVLATLLAPLGSSSPWNLAVVAIVFREARQELSSAKFHLGLTAQTNNDTIAISSWKYQVRNFNPDAATRAKENIHKENSTMHRRRLGYYNEVVP